MKKRLVLLVVVLLVLAMAAPAMAKPNSMTMTSKTSGFLALGYWDSYDTDGEYCWGSYSEVYITDMNPKSEFVTLEIFMVSFRYPCEYYEEGIGTIKENRDGPIDPGYEDEYYWNTFQVPRKDFVVGKKLENGAVLDTMTYDGPIHLEWTITETNFERGRNTFATDGYKYSYRVNSKYGIGFVSGQIFEEEMGNSNYGAMGYVSTFEKVRQTM